MSCLNPTHAWQDKYLTTSSGKHPVIFSFNELSPDFYSWRDTPQGAQFTSNRYIPLSVPCGHCVLCRKRRAYEITCRALMEKLAHPDEPASFITLTVDDENMPKVFPGQVLHHRPWQLFAKRLRKEVGSFRFLMCGEYGESSKRPHYHAIIFGHDLTRDFEWLPDGTRIESKTVKKCWPFGHIMSRRCSDGAIAYVAGYQLKLDNDMIDIEQLLHNEEFLESDYEDKVQLKNYVKWSRNPGLGADFLLCYPNMIRKLQQIAPDGFKYDMESFTLVRSRKLFPFHSRFLLKFLERIQNGEVEAPLTLKNKFDIIRASRERGVFLRHLHSPPDCEKVNVERLKNRAEILNLTLAAKKRDLDA